MRGKKMSNNRSLIVFAWAMETVGVSAGAINSAYTTFGEKLPETLLGYLPAIPMAVLALAELGRVPLASAVYQKQRLVQSVAILGIMALGYLAVENWTFGFERIVDLRLKPVNSASRDLEGAQQALAGLQAQKERTLAASREKQEQLRNSLLNLDETIEKNNDQLDREAKQHQENLTQIRESCRLIREKCMVPRSKDEDERYAGQIDRLNSELAIHRNERNILQSQLQASIANDSNALVQLDQGLASANITANVYRQDFRLAASNNQIYRLAASWYGVDVARVTSEQFAAARFVFSTFSSIAVALAGTVAALVYYSHNRSSQNPSEFVRLVAPLVRARRAYYARRRRLLVRETPGPERVVYREGAPPPIVLEKEVSRFVDRIVLIPRFGIRFPVYLNRLFEEQKRDNIDSTLSNVKAFSKRGA
jgi:hypothetical protein